MGRRQRQITGTIAGGGLALSLAELIDALTRHDQIPDVPWIKVVYLLSILSALAYRLTPTALAVLDRDQDGALDMFQRKPDGSTRDGETYD